jgi:hypothetical protein
LEESFFFEDDFLKLFFELFFEDIVATGGGRGSTGMTIAGSG